MSLKVTFSFTHEYLDFSGVIDDFPVIVLIATISAGGVEATLKFAPAQSHIMVQSFTDAEVTEEPTILRWDQTFMQWSLQRVILHTAEENRYSGEDSMFHADLPYDPSFAEVMAAIAAIKPPTKV
jgi:hypothetical protein